MQKQKSTKQNLRKIGLYVAAGMAIMIGLSTMAVQIQTNVRNAVQVISRIFITTDGFAPLANESNLSIDLSTGGMRIKAREGSTGNQVLSIDVNGKIIKIPLSGLATGIQDIIKPCVLGTTGCAFTGVNQNDSLYNFNKPITRDFDTLTNVSVGTGGTGTIKDFLDAVFYPETLARPTIAGGTAYEYESTAGTKAATLNWSVTRRDATISSIRITSAGGATPSTTTITPNLPNNGSVQNGTLNVQLPKNAPSSFTIAVTDSAGRTFSSTTNFTWYQKMYYGLNSATSLTNAQILALGYQPTAYSPTITNPVVVTYQGTLGYRYAVLPETYFAGGKVLKAKTGPGYEDRTCNTQSLTNAGGYATNYRVCRSPTTQQPSNIFEFAFSVQ